ncbi:MAG TPA: RNA polymerase sigma factor [Chloroflexia bacterium]|nr:RNA polymerase sigma factor [Chloroflexia bacterium]
MEDPEGELIARIARGDRLAFTELYTRYRLPLFHYLLHFTTDAGLAEELLQDTLVAAWQGAPHFRGQGRPLAWLFGIARRRAGKTLRRRVLPRTDAAALAMVPAPDLEPEAALLAGAARADLVAAISRLAPIHREVLWLTFVQELAYQETAAILGVPLGTVKSRLSNAKQALRRLLQAAEEAGK